MTMIQFLKTVCASLLMTILPVLTIVTDRRQVRPSIVIKIICSSLFLMTGVLGMIEKPGICGSLILVALVFCLVGDAFLEIPKENCFLPGMIAFMIGHILYIAAFQTLSAWNPVTLLIAVLIGSAVALAGHFLGAHTGKLTIPVLIYMFAISLMVVTALRTSVPMICAGALLFMFSDGVLAYNKFVKPIRLASGMVIGPYYVGQTLIALSIAFL